MSSAGRGAKVLSPRATPPSPTSLSPTPNPPTPTLKDDGRRSNACHLSWVQPTWSRRHQCPTYQYQEVWTPPTNQQPPPHWLGDLPCCLHSRRHFGETRGGRWASVCLISQRAHPLFFILFYTLHLCLRQIWSTQIDVLVILIMSMDSHCAHSLLLHQ